MDNQSQLNIWNGIVEYARNNDINLTAYFGTYQMTTNDIASHFDTCFEAIRKSDSLDGLIILSGYIAHIINNDVFEKYITTLPPSLPLVSVSYVIPGVPSVIVDNLSGMYSAVDHLIKVHGKKNIAFIKGPDGHIEAEDRLRGYKNALEANGIPFDNKLIFPGNFDQNSGRNAVDKIIKNPSLSVEAITASNDASAVGVLRELALHNLSAPADFAVTGFDDIKGSAVYIPSISTAQQNFHKFGLTGAELLLKQIRGEPVDEIIKMPPVFITRQSCGCIEEGFNSTALKCEENKDKSDSLSSYILTKMPGIFKKDIPESQINKWAVSITEKIKNRPFIEKELVSLLNEILISYSNYSKDYEVWNEVINIISLGTELFCDEVESLDSIRTALTFGTTFIYNIPFKEREYREIVQEDNRWRLKRVAGNLDLIFDIDLLAEELYNRLPSISINTILIGLYRNPIKNNETDSERTYNTLIGFDDDKIIKIINSNDKSISFADYSLIEEFDYEKERRELFFIPLFFRDEEFGVMLMPFDHNITIDTYETLRINISTTIKGAELVNEIKKQNDLLKSALASANEANNAKSNFLSSMSHEIRTPLNAIIGMTIIGKKGKSFGEKDNALHKIGEASAHLLGVINDILDMSKIEANKLVLAPINFEFDHMLQKVMTVVNFRIEECKQSFSMNIDKSIPRYIIADEQRLMQVITNLMSNAVKFTPENGKIHIDASMYCETDEGCELCISVKDSGIGISTEQQERLFQAFEQADSGTTREYGGTGLGLVISRNIIELMGGRIWIESELGKGAKFIFTIKVLRGEAKKGDDEDSESPDEVTAYVDGEFAGKSLLIAEDMEINREIMMSLLDGTGLIVECVENGQEAVERVESSHDKYDIIFMDVQMPKMDGYDATRAIRALPFMKDKKLPIIAMTANVFKSDIDKCIESGMDAHLGKPIDFEKVISILRKYLYA